jgi:hypothetical protein
MDTLSQSFRVLGVDARSQLARGEHVMRALGEIGRHQQQRVRQILEGGHRQVLLQQPPKALALEQTREAVAAPHIHHRADRIRIPEVLPRLLEQQLLQPGSGMPAAANAATMPPAEVPA